MRGQEASEFARYTTAPIHDSAKDVEDEGFDLVHDFAAHFLSNSQISGKPISSHIRPNP